MATYRISGPDGHTYQVTAPDGASQADVLSYVQKNAAQPEAHDVGTGAALGHGLLDAASFGLFDKAAPYAAAALSHVTPGPNLTVDQARGVLAGNEQATDAAHPIAHVAGEIGGAIAGGGVLERAGVKVLSKVAPRAVQAARDALALQKGQPLRNVARLAATGAASGGAYGATAGAVQGSDDGVGGAVTGALQGAALGAAGGAVLGPAGAAVVKGGSMAVRAFSGPSAKAIAALAKKFNMAPGDLDTAYRNYMANAGHPPSLAEIADLQSRGELQALAHRNPVTGAAVETARQKAASDLPTYLSDKAASTVGHPQDLSDLVQARDAAATQAMNPIRDRHIGLSPDEADFMKGDITQHMGIKGPVRHEIAEQLNGGTLSLGNADTIRKNLSAQARSKPGEGYDQLANEFNSIVRSASPEYGAMLDKYVQHSDYIDAFQHGTTGKTVGQTSDPALIKSLQTPEGQQGYQAGLATRIHDQSFKNETSAASTARDLSQRAATATNVNRTFGPAATQPLANAAAAKSKGLENLSVISPGTPRPQSGDATALTHAAVGMAGTLKGGIYHGAQVLNHITQGMKLPPAVQIKLGQMLTDPRQSQQAISYLRAQGARDHDLRVLLTQVAKRAARPGGAAASYLQGQLK